MEDKRLVVIQRAWSDHRATIGMLTVVGVEHDPIFTLENPNRNGAPDDRIPPGKYECIPYSGAQYKDVYLIKDVPGRSAILIHWGNFEINTLGCILVGLGSAMMINRRTGKIEPSVSHSRQAFKKLKELIGDNPFTIEILP